MSKTYNALRFRQGKHVLFLFSVDGKELGEIASAPTLSQGEDGLIGYQRDEIKTHVKTIRDYFDNTASPLLPNALTIAFEVRPRFKASEENPDIGTLTISKPGLMVDGRQRTAALRDSSLTAGDFPVAVVGFVAESEAEQREHFLRLNASKPLPTSLINTLLPGIETPISGDLDRKRLATTILSRLANDEDSPLQGVVKTVLNPGGYVTDGTVIDMVQAALSESDSLRDYRNEGNLDEIVKTFKNYWSAVNAVFAEAWKKHGPESRLFMRAGVMSLGKLMSEMMNHNDGKSTRQLFEKGLRLVEPACRWTPTEQKWIIEPNDRRPWDGVENTMTSARALGEMLCGVYRAALKKAAKAEKNAQPVEDTVEAA